MKVLGIRFCVTSSEAESLANFFGDGLGLPLEADCQTDTEDFTGAVFPAGNSWIEVWPTGPEMPAGTMLQIEVDDADAWAEQVRQNGLKPQGPIEAHGDKIYFVQAPTGLPVTFQSKMAE